MELVFASNNPHKAGEVRRILHGITVRTPADLGLTFAFEENGPTFHENALGKARHLYRMLGRPVLADDSGLAVDALGGAPGVRSARFGPPGVRLDDAGRTRHLLELLAGEEHRAAAFVCCVALVLDDRRLLLVQETVAGAISDHPRGANGFGYDPVFLLPAQGRTMAELSPAEKDALSHRGRALRRCRALLESDAAAQQTGEER
jgi:XTP/dITP diphosphohydrolase